MTTYAAPVEAAFGGWSLQPQPRVMAKSPLKVGFIASAWDSFSGTCSSATMGLLVNPEFGYSYALFQGAVLIAPETSAELLQKIRDIFKPSMSDLAAIFGVSRQTLYNWINGEEPRPELAHRLDDIATAAGMLAASGLGGSKVLHRKIHDGKSLFDIFMVGGLATDAAVKLIAILEKEAAQRQRMAKRFSGRVPGKISADFEFPAPNDRD